MSVRVAWHRSVFAPPRMTSLPFRPSNSLTATRVGVFFVLQRTLVLSPLTCLQPLPGLIATRSSMVTVRPERVMTTLFFGTS